MVRTWPSRLLLVVLGTLVVFAQGTRSHGRTEGQAQGPGPGQGQGQVQPQGQAGAPASQQQPPVFRAGVKLVRVDVTATGRDDQPVDDLTLEDFEVTEDGVPQRVEQAQFVRLTGSRPEGDEASLDIRSQEHAEAEAAREDVRVFAIFLDDYHIDKTPDIMLPLRRGLSDFVRRLWPSDLVAIMEPLTPLSDLKFTRSQPDLLAAIQAFEGRQGELFPVKSILEEAQLQSGDVRRMRAEVTMSALAALATRLGGLKEGRKTIIFVSQGPSTYMWSSRGNLQDRMRDISQAASRGNVSIYPVDPRGLGADSHPGSRDTLYQLAAETGGRAIVNTNLITGGLDRMLMETSAYYVLGYTPTRTEDDGKYHKISVKVRRSGVRVSARPGYWAPSPQETEAAARAAAKTLEPAVEHALAKAAAVEPGNRAVVVWLGMAPAPDGRTLMSVAWEPSGGERRLEPAALDVDVLSEEAAEGAARPAPRTVPPTQDAAVAPAAPPIEMAPGETRVRFVARAADGSVVDEWVDTIKVPDFSRLDVGMAAPRAHRAPSLAEWRAIRAAPDPQPAANWHFRRTDRVLIDTAARARSGEPVTFDVHVLSREGKELTELPVPAAEGGRLRFELPVRSLGVGTYLLRVRARAGGPTTEWLSAFRVIP